MKMHGISLTGFVLAVILVAPATRSYAEDFPLPKDIIIVAPNQGVAENLASFSGKWQGEWYGNRTNTLMFEQLLIVEKITGDTATVVYSWIPRWGNNTPSWIRLDASLKSDGTLVVVFPSGRTATYKMDKKGNLSATLHDSQGINNGILKKVP